MGILTQPKFHQCAKHCIRAFGIFLEADGFWEGWGRSRLCPPPTWLCDPGRVTSLPEPGFPVSGMDQ